MRTKDEILKLGNAKGVNGIHDKLNMGRRDLLILEVLIDLRDILSLQLEMIHTSIFDFLHKK